MEKGALVSDELVTKLVEQKVEHGLDLKKGFMFDGFPRTVKQAQDHDPHGRFVRRWLPVLRKVPDSWLFEPWKMPPDVQAHCGVIIGKDWPLPPVELESATRNAKNVLHARRAQPEVKSEKSAIVERHGSRLRPQTKARKAVAAQDVKQGSFEF